MALSTYYLKKLEWKIWYELTDKYGTNKHLDAYTLINATFPQSNIGLKIKKSRKTECGIVNLPPKQACMQNLVKADR